MTSLQHFGTAGEALTQLSELVRLARVYRDAATLDGRPGTAQTWASTADKLDSVRTTLLQEGVDYLPVAWAFVDSGRLTISRGVARDSRRPGARRPADTPTTPAVPTERRRQ
jgi:hypothetical protein